MTPKCHTNLPISKLHTNSLLVFNGVASTKREALVFIVYMYISYIYIYIYPFVLQLSHLWDWDSWPLTCSVSIVSLTIPPTEQSHSSKQETIRLTKRPRTTCILCMKSYFVYHINLVCKENSNPPTRFENKNQRGLHRGPHWLLRNPIAVQNPIKI